MVRHWAILLIAAGVLGILVADCPAHPVPRENHDRTITVHVKLIEKDQIEVLVNYRLEVDELTVLLDDMKPFRDQVDPGLFRGKQLEYYAEFARIYAPILAGNLVAKANGKALKFTCTKREQTVKDEKDEALGHLRCDFTFRATFPFLPGKENVLVFRETNYHDQAGKVDLSLGKIEGVKIESKVEPDAALKKRAEIELRPGDEDRLRSAEVRFTIPGSKARESDPPPHSDDEVSDSATTVGSRIDRNALQTGLGLIMGLVVAAMGVWLLLQRLSGRADHVHFGGGQHHHHHHHGHDHHHHEHGAHTHTHDHDHSHDPATAPGWWTLVVLGISGGIIPCWDAIALLVLTIGTSEFWLALPLLLAFSAGLAAVLVLIGILVVKARNLLGAHWGEGRFVRSLPYVSAILITAMGIWLCYESVHGSSTSAETHDLLRLFQGEGGLWLLLGLGVLLGAAHALTPGHGKTLVAAYLVGQRGTVLHACVLGLVTTLTHTGVVLLIALGLYFW